MAIIFDMEKMQTKLIIAVIIMFVFTLLYLLLPKSHFGITNIYNNVLNNNINNIDILEFSVKTQIGAENTKLYPLTLTTKIMTMLQYILGYSILLI